MSPDGSSDPLARWLDLIAKGYAFDPMVLNYAAHLLEHDPGGYERLVLAAKTAKVRLGRWEAAVKATGGPAPTPGAPVPVERTQDIGGDWRDLLARGRGGAIRNTFGNLCTILRGDPEYASLAWNAMTGEPELREATLGDATLGQLREAIERVHQIQPAVEALVSAVRVVAEERAYHPVRRYLEGITWDGTPRIAGLAEHVLGVTGDHLAGATAQLRAWLVSACARAQRPGCKADAAIVLVGPQGWYKSSFFRVLGGTWFRDTRIDLRSKDAFLQLRDAWIYEWSELDHVTSASHAGELKAFLSSSEDSYRPPYGRSITRVPRSQVFCGTTNEVEFLSDPTGDRRFWVIRLGRPITDLAAVAVVRDQIWAEAMAAFKGGEDWHLDRDSEATRQDQAETHRATDPWEDLVQQWLDARTVPELELPVVSSVLLAKALKLEPYQQTRAAQNRLGAVLRRLGFDRTYSRQGSSVVRVWSRPDQ